MPRIKAVLQGVNMAYGHDGLTLAIKKQTDIDVRVLDADEMVICINSYGDKLKAIGGGGVVVGYLRMPKGRKLMKEAIQFLPRVFGGDGFSYDDACREAIEASPWSKKRIYFPRVTQAKFVATFIKELANV